MAVDALIFDDDPYFVGYLASILEDLGLSVKFFHDSYGALDHIRRESPELVFLDVMMPGEDGLSVCKSIKADHSFSRIKVTIMSGKGFTEDQARADWAKADLYVVKPFDPHVFSEQVQQLARGFKKSASQILDLSSQSCDEKRKEEGTPSDAEERDLRDPWALRFWGSGHEAD